MEELALKAAKHQIHYLKSTFCWEQYFLWHYGQGKTGKILSYRNYSDRNFAGLLLKDYRAQMPYYTKLARPENTLEGALFRHYHNLIEKYYYLRFEDDIYNRRLISHFHWLLGLSEIIIPHRNCPYCGVNPPDFFLLGSLDADPNNLLYSFDFCYCRRRQCHLNAVESMQAFDSHATIWRKCRLQFSSLIQFSGQIVEQISTVFRQAFYLSEDFTDDDAFEAIIKADVYQTDTHMDSPCAPTAPIPA